MTYSMPHSTLTGLINDLPDGILFLEPVSGNILYANSRMQALFGYTSSEMLSLNSSNLHPADNELKLLPELQSNSRPQNLLTLSVPCIRKDGTLFYADITSRFSRVEGQDYLIGSFRLSDERLKTENRLREVETVNTSILASVPDGITIASLDSFILYTNQRIWEMFGYQSLDDLKGRLLFDLLVPEDRERAINNVKNLIGGGNSSPANYSGIKADGSTFPIQVNRALIKNQDHQPDQLLLIVRDQSTMDSLQKNLQIRIKELNFLYDLTDLFSQQDYFTEDWPKAVLDHLPMGFQFPEDIQARIIIGASTWQTDDYPNESQREISVPIVFNHKQYGVLSVVKRQRDSDPKAAAFPKEKLNFVEEIANRLARYIDKENLVQELVKVKTLAEESNRMKNAFLLNISHEIRTPLNGIMGFSSLLGQPDLGMTERELYQKLIKVSGNRLIQTITDYVDASSILSGGLFFKIAPVPLKDILEPLKEKYTNRSVEQNLGFFTNFPDNYANLYLVTDLALAAKAFDHVLDNAFKFTKAGIIDWTCEVLDTTISFQISDSGIGIDPVFLSTITSFFTQEIEGFNRPYEGSGLGLAITKGFMDLLGGEISITSVKGHGTNVTLIFPFNKEGVASREDFAKGTTGVIQVEPTVALVVEDDLSNSLYLKHLLHKNGFQVIQTGNGRDAVSICKTQRDISILFMDLKLPLMDGYAASRLIKEIRPDLPIIAITAYGMIGEEKKAMEAGCSEYLEKPFSEAELMRRVKKYFSSKP